LATAAAAIGLYALAGDWPPPMPSFALRVGAFALVGLCMGVVSEQARQQREALEQQHEQMIRSDRLATVGELAAGLAHELRNPLAGISGVLRVLAGRLPFEDTTRALLADVQAQTARMDKTLTDLLQHARPAAPTMVGLDVNGLLEQSLRVLPRGPIEIVRQFDESLPPLPADPGLLHQAFLNILVNARQAMPEGGRLTVRTQLDETDGRTIRVLISDSGIGIPPEHLGRVFEAFFTTKSQGTGLGLAIAARAVERHGGRIAVASEAGRGTTFTIALPVGPAIGCGRREAHAVSGAGR
jgi:signal transduction histidine kinase